MEFVRRSTFATFFGLLGDMRREFMQYIFVVLHGALSSCLRDALHESKKSIRCCLPLRSASLDLLVVSSFLMMVSNNANYVFTYKI
jgi:hypothetical protein